MAIPLDDIARKKLILVKQLYQQGVVLASHTHTGVRRIISVVVFDVAIEGCLKAIVASLEASKQPSDEFQGLVQQVNSILVQSGLGALPDKPNIQHVHSIRNDAQHKAKYPNDSDVSDCRTYTRDFLRKAASLVWGLDFDRLTLTDMVNDARVKAYLVTAETALANNNYPEAIRQATAGIDVALSSVKSAFVGHMSPFTKEVITHNRGKFESDKDMIRALERMQETLMCVALGISYADYMSYRKTAGMTLFTAGGFDNYGMKKDPNASDAEYVVAYSTDQVVRIEEQVGSLASPFGKDFWQ